MVEKRAGGAERGHGRVGGIVTGEWGGWVGDRAQEGLVWDTK